MNCESSNRRFFVPNHIMSDTLIPSLIGLPHIRYHQISTIDQCNSKNKIKEFYLVG